MPDRRYVATEPFRAAKPLRIELQVQMQLLLLDWLALNVLIEGIRAGCASQSRLFSGRNHHGILASRCCAHTSVRLSKDFFEVDHVIFEQAIGPEFKWSAHYARRVHVVLPVVRRDTD